MNDYFEDMDYILNPSLKEAFSYVTAEAMAKGIKPILHNWLGAGDTWRENWLYLTPDEAVDMILSGYTEKESKNYRKYIEERYDARRMCREVDELLRIK
jgi:glycosyltransferase involved in cell wall biosynthesis